MFKAWMVFAFDAARLGAETQSVVALRMMRLAQGGSSAQREAQLMLTEKNLAFAEAIGTLAVGGSVQKVMRRYRSHLRANRSRLTR